MIFWNRLFAHVVIAIALIGLAGCAGKELQRSDGYVRSASSASVRFYVPASLPVSISRIATYSTRVIDDHDRAQANASLKAMFKETEKVLDQRLSETLSKAGLQAGDDLIIAVNVEQAWHSDMGPGARFNVQALFKNPPRGAGVLSFKLEAKATLFVSSEKSIATFVDQIMNEIKANGMIGPEKAR